MQVSFRTSVPANDVVPNVLAGSTHQYLKAPARVTFGVVAEAVGVLATALSGTDQLMEESPINVRGVGVLPLANEDFTLSDVADVNELLVLRLRNTTGAPIVVRSTVIIEYL